MFLCLANYIQAILRKVRLYIVLWLLLTVSIAHADGNFSFLVATQPVSANSVFMKQLVVHANKESSAFLVINGVKAQSEPCSDALYIDRKTVINNANKPVVLSLTGNDWAYCTGIFGQSLAIERLTRVKEIFFEDNLSLGETPMTLYRQSVDERYSSFTENATWEKNGILFATIHLPSDNNHFSSAAGRNNEFEDRAIANEKWLESLFRHAKSHHYKAIVLFTDGNPYQQTQEENDGFAWVRQTLNNLLQSFNKSVLLIYSAHQSQSSHIIWTGKLGLLGSSPKLTKVSCQPNAKQVFVLNKNTVKKRSRKKYNSFK